MKFARIVERGNRQILLNTAPALQGDGFIVVIETNYQGEQFVSLYVGDYPTRSAAYDAMMSLTDDEVMQNIANVLDAISEEE